MSWDVYKFGGTSVQNAECIRRVMSIVLATDRTRRLAVVVSAMAKVTDRLIQAVDDAAKGGEWFKQQGRKELGDRHLEAAKTLLAPADFAEYQAQLSRDLDDIENICHGIRLARDFSMGQMDLLSGYGIAELQRTGRVALPKLDRVARLRAVKGKAG